MAKKHLTITMFSCTDLGTDNSATFHTIVYQIVFLGQALAGVPSRDMHRNTGLSLICS